MIEAYCTRFMATVSKESGSPLFQNFSDMSGYYKFVPNLIAVLADITEFIVGFLSIEP